VATAKSSEGLRSFWKSATTLGYSLAPFSVAAALIICLLVRRDFHLQYPLAWFFLAAVVVSVWYGGTGPGLVAVIVSTLVIDYFFFPPRYSWAMNPAEARYLILFFVGSLLTIWFSSKRRGAEKALKEAGDEWRRRWQSAARLLDGKIQLQSEVTELIDRNARLQREVTELRERIKELEKVVRDANIASGSAKP
jgi:K+-sensing histidine kinase KdpD